MRTLKATARDTDDGRLIKHFLRSELGLSSHQLSVAKFSGGIFVNGVNVRADYPLKPGDLIELCIAEHSERAVRPEEGPVPLPYADQDVMVIDKPAPLACQCSERQSTGTLENRLAWHFRDRDSFVFRPVNRLDKGTSGLMAAAMHPLAFRNLQSALHTDGFVREYLAVVDGLLYGSGTIDLPIAKEPAASVRRIVDNKTGKPSVTHYRAIRQGRGRTLVRLRLETGRTHQIRVHMRALGHPVTGDFLYGTEIDALPGRFALHSAYIAFDHPVTGARIVCESPLPEPLERLLL